MAVFLPVLAHTLIIAQTAEGLIHKARGVAHQFQCPGGTFDQQDLLAVELSYQFDYLSRIEYSRFWGQKMPDSSF